METPLKLPIAAHPPDCKIKLWAPGLSAARFLRSVMILSVRARLVARSSLGRS